MPDPTRRAFGRADLDAAIAKAEAHCATYFRALAARPGERDARLLHLEKEELAELRARRDRLRRHLEDCPGRGPKLSEKDARNGCPVRKAVQLDFGLPFAPCT